MSYSEDMSYLVVLWQCYMQWYYELQWGCELQWGYELQWALQWGYEFSAIKDRLVGSEIVSLISLKLCACHISS